MTKAKKAATSKKTKAAKRIKDLKPRGEVKAGVRKAGEKPVE